MMGAARLTCQLTAWVFMGETEFISESELMLASPGLFWLPYKYDLDFYDLMFWIKCMIKELTSESSPFSLQNWGGESSWVAGSPIATQIIHFLPHIVLKFKTIQFSIMGDLDLYFFLKQTASIMPNCMPKWCSKVQVPIAWSGSNYPEPSK